MTPERYLKVVELFQAASDHSPEARPAFLAQACADDDKLRNEVEAMLGADQASDHFLDQSLNDIAAEALAARTTDSLIGQRLGEYEVLERLGAGGMGEVYLARDTRLGRKAALKLLPQEFATDANWLRRFEQEARTISALNHPNIVTIYGIGQAGPVNFLATELVEGRTLREEMAHQPLTSQAAIDIALQVAAALTAAHAAGIIHRDIKPENIMLRPDGIVKVLDFGLAKNIEQEVPSDHRTTPGIVMGTVLYMSPEQARAAAVDARSDLFSLGVVLYEMIAGNPPFAGPTPSDVIAEILKTPTPSLAAQASADLQRIVSKALRKEKEERYQSAQELALDLKNLRQRQDLASIREARRPHRRALVLVLLTVVAAIAGITWFQQDRKSVFTAIQAVAVLPFANVNNDPNTEYLADAFSENLINGLSQLPQLKVIASRSAFQYKGKTIDVTEVAKALGVSLIVTGSVLLQRDGSLLVTVELVNARDRAKIWGERYDRKAVDLQSVQNELVRNIAARLHISLTGQQEQQLSEGGTSNPEAHRLYFTAVYHGRKAGLASRRTALDFYNQAIAADPKFARAYVGVAAVYEFFSATGASDPKESSAKAKEAVKKALELAPNLAAALSVLAVIHDNEWDWTSAEKEYRQAIALNPGLADARGNYALHLMTLRRFPEALAENKRAQELDPLHPNHRSHEGTILYNARRYDEALRLFQNDLRVRPNYGFTYVHIGYVHNAKGMYADAIPWFQKSMSILTGSETSTYCYLGYAYARSGQRSRALALLKQLKESKEYVSAAELAILHMGLGDKEGAFTALEKAYADHDLQMQYLAVDPHYDDLRSDIRFDALVRMIGLPH